jgi:RNA polymerase sigma factor (TIGR02999 family)
VHWRSRVQFFVIASQMMRRVLLDHARGRAAAKREGRAVRVALDDDVLGTIEPRGCDLLQLDRALAELTRLDPRQAGIVELFYFGGLSEEEIGDAVSLSRSTIARELRSAKAWLYRRMTTDGRARA